MSDRGVIVEFDFTVLNGAELLFKTTKKFLKELDDIAFDAPTEARYLAGGSCQGSLTGLFAAVKTKKTEAKAAKDLMAAFAAAVTAAAPAAVTPAFRNFVKAIADRGVRVVIATRADLEQVREAFASVLGERVTLFHERSTCYGAVKWDAWRLACASASLRPMSTMAVAGSGYSVKSALMAGLGAFAVTNPHVAYQDFGGADDVVDELSGTTAKRLIEALRI